MSQGIAKKTCDVLVTMPSALHSVIQVVEDFERGAADVGLLLGREPAWLGSEPATGARLALFPLANMTLEVRGPPGGVGPPVGADAGDGVGWGEGLDGMRLAFDDLPRAAKGLVERGVKCGPIRQQSAEGESGAPDREWRSLSLDLAASRSIPIELVSPPRRSRAREAGEAREDRSVIEALDHVVVLSTDVEATRDFYGAGLGIRLALDRSFEARGVRLLFFRLGGVTIEIGARLGAEPRSDTRDRFGGLAWRVSDVEAARARLLSKGFDVSDLRDGHKPGTRVCTVRAPVHGVPTLLIEPAA